MVRLFELCAIIIAPQINSLYAQPLYYPRAGDIGEQVNPHYYDHKINEKRVRSYPEFSYNSSFYEYAYSRSEDDSTGSPDKKFSYRSPKTTFLIAFFPGYLIHGLGHLYIRNYKTAVLLLATEALGFLYGFGGENDEAFILYFGSWAYDWIAAPLICHRRNQKARNVSLQPFVRSSKISDQYAGLMLNISF